MKLLYVLLPAVLLTTEISVTATEYYVSVTGSDAASGTLAAPFRTVQKAADAAVAGDTILLRGGIYRETVRPARSGTAGNLITFAAYSNESVVVSACDPVTGWTVHSGDIWKANCNWDVGTGGDGNTLFVDGVLKFEAREKAETDPMDLNDWGYIAKGDMTSTAFTANDLKGWGNGYWTGAKVRHHQNDWTVRTTTITGYDSATGKIYFNNIGGISQKHQFGYYIFGTINPSFLSVAIIP